MPTNLISILRMSEAFKFEGESKEYVKNFIRNANGQALGRIYQRSNDDTFPPSGPNGLT